MKPGWCSGRSYDPVTVVTRVQIPPRALVLLEYLNCVVLILCLFSRSALTSSHEPLDSLAARLFRGGLPISMTDFPSKTSKAPDEMNRSTGVSTGFLRTFPVLY